MEDGVGTRRHPDGSSAQPIQNPLRWDTPSTFRQDERKYTYRFPNIPLSS